MVTDYEIVLHLRDSGEKLPIALPGVAAEQAEADREVLVQDLERARLAEVPVVSVQTAGGHPDTPLAVDPHQVTKVDLVDASADDERPDG